MKGRVRVFKFQDSLGGYFALAIMENGNFKTVGFSRDQNRFETRRLAKKAGDKALEEMDKAA